MREHAAAVLDWLRRRGAWALGLSAAMGAWAMFANAAAPLPRALTAGGAQALTSLLTFVAIGPIMARIAGSAGPGAWRAAGAIAFGFTAAAMIGAQLLAGASDLARTLFPPLAAAAIQAALIARAKT